MPKPSQKRSEIGELWAKLLGTHGPYVSPKPSTQYGFQAPSPARAETDPRLNNQPWYSGGYFGGADIASDSIPDPRYPS